MCKCACVWKCTYLWCSPILLLSRDYWHFGIYSECKYTATKLGNMNDCNFFVWYVILNWRYECAYVIKCTYLLCSSVLLIPTGNIVTLRINQNKIIHQRNWGTRKNAIIKSFCFAHSFKPYICKIIVHVPKFLNTNFYHWSIKRKNLILNWRYSNSHLT